MFSDSKQSSGSSPSGEIDKDFQPTQGAYFRTQEYPERNEQSEVIGRIWLEAGYDPKKKTWILWQKTIRRMDDPLSGEKVSVISPKVLFEKTDFVSAYDQMTTFEVAQKSLGIDPLTTKTPAKLGGDYYKQFAWREGLMMSRSGRLYPFTEDKLNAANYFDAQDITDANAFLMRLKSEQFVPVPIVLPSTDWAKAYEENKKAADERLNLLYFRYNDERDNHELALQIVGQETPEVLYAHIQRGFSPKIFENDPEKHFALVKAAIDRPSVESLSLLTEAGVSFYVRWNDETPLELVLKQRRYSHLYVMLSRDGATLANYTDESGNTPAVTAMSLQDRQAFRMFYLEGLDYSHVDARGLALVHHAFDNSFLPGIYAWLAEGLPIDQPVRGTSYTGLSIARFKQDQPLIDFALQQGANPKAPDLPTTIEPAAEEQPAAVHTTDPVPVKQSVAFSLELLNSAAANSEIEAAAAAYAAQGGSFNLLSDKGVSLLETCWKNRKPDPQLDRRALIPVLGKLGADPSALLDDGTTVLTRIASGTAFDADFLKAVAPFAKDANSADAEGNNILHALQLNSSETVSHSNNVAAILKLFPALDLNRQNNDGYSNVALAIRLNRSQTLKSFNAAAVKWDQTVKGGWTLLDLAFTSACGQEKVEGAPRAGKINAASDAVRNAILDMLARAGDKKSLAAAFNHTRPDGQTLFDALTGESAPAQTVTRLKGYAQPGPKT